MVTDSFNKVIWKNGISEPTYFNANNLNSINSETVRALNELENEITGASATILTVYRSLNLFPSAANIGEGIGAINPNGRGAGVVGDYSVAFGHNSVASGENSIALGKNASSAGINSIAIGNEANADSAGSIKISSGGTIDTAMASIFIGALSETDSSNILGERSVSVGFDAKALGENSIQLGTGTNNIEDSLQVFNQNIYRKFIEIIEETEYITNIFGNTPGQNTKNLFLGNSQGALTTLGPEDNIRNIIDVFEENSPVVKNTTNALKAIPNDLESPTGYYQFAYTGGSLITNLTTSESLPNAKEVINRSFTIYTNNNDAEYSSATDTSLNIQMREGDLGTIKSGDLLKIELVDKSNVSFPKTFVIYMKIENNASEYFESLNNTYYSEDKLWCKTWRLHYFKSTIEAADYSSFQIDSGYITQIYASGVSDAHKITDVAVAGQYPIIKKISKIY